MPLHRHMLRAVWLLLPISIASVAVALAESEQAGGRRVIERIEDTAKKVGDNIERGVSRTAKTIDQKHVGEKVERKLKKAVTKTEEGLKKAGRKIEEKLGP
jgi:erythromycin esterase-like protein